MFASWSPDDCFPVVLRLFNIDGAFCVEWCELSSPQSLVDAHDHDVAALFIIQMSVLSSLMGCGPALVSVVGAIIATCPVGIGACLGWT